MDNKNLSFEVENFNIIDDYSNAQFAIVEIAVCHSGNNLHNMPIDLSVIKKAKKTLKNKFLVAGFDGEDFEGHEPDEVIVGFFPESSKMSFKEKDGRTYLVAEAIMSKMYAKWAYDVFVEENNRAVSMEITVLETEENEDDGLEYITKFVFNGVTLLGKSHLPACEGSNASIIKFSKENALEVYSKHFKSSDKIKKNFVKDMNLADNSGKEGTDNMEKKDLEVKETEKVEEVTEEVKTESDDTTLMEESKEVKCETNEEENSKEEDKNTDEEDEDKEEVSDDEEKDENEDKKFESLTVDQKYEIFRTAIKEVLCNAYLESFDDEYLYVYTWKECCESNTYRYAYTLEGTACTIDTTNPERVVRGGYVVFEESDEPKEGAEAEKDAEMEALKTENCELKDKIEKYETAEKEKAVEEILSEVVDIISNEKMSELREEAKNYSLDNLGTFENEVKAIAFEAVKHTTNKYSFTKMTVNEIEKPSSKYGW